MKVELKKDAPDRVEVGLGPRVYLFERGQVTEVEANDWAELERRGYFEVAPEAPLVQPPTGTDVTDVPAKDKKK